MRIIAIFFFIIAAAWGQVQAGRVAASWDGRVIVMESAAALRGAGEMGPDHILSFRDGEGVTESVGGSSPLYGGVAFPFTNDFGDLRAFTLTRPPICSGIGGCGSPGYEGIVRNALDGWEVRYPGKAAMSQEGRWAVFSSPGWQRTTWVDLWTGKESVAAEAYEILAMADDGTVVAPRGQALLVAGPGREARRIELPFYAMSAMVDRTGMVAAVTSQSGIYRVELVSGKVEEWAAMWDNAQLDAISAGGGRLLFRQWSIGYVMEWGGGPRRLTAEGEYTYGQALTGDGRAAVATTIGGVVRYELETGAGEMVVVGDTGFAEKPAVLAPGLWVRMSGRGAARAEVRLDGQAVETLWRRPGELAWVVPEWIGLGRVRVEVSQPGSPFEPFREELTVQSAAPRILVQRDLGEGTPYYSDAPYVRHAETKRAVNWDDPARPGDLIEVLVTGLNGQGAAVEWLVNKINVDEYVRLLFEGEEVDEREASWRWVRLRMPEVVPGPWCRLSAVYGGVWSSALMVTSTGIVN